MSRVRTLLQELCSRGVEYEPLGSLGVFIRGSSMLKSDLVDAGFPAIHYGQVHTIYGTSASETVSFVRDTFAAKLRKAKPGDLIIATTSEDDEAVAKAVAWVGTSEVAISGDAYIFRHSLEPRFVSYFFQSNQFHKQKANKLTGAKVRRISGENLAKIKMPVPPIEVQREIVSILDSLCKLEDDLIAELQAELEARSRQYTFYLEQLMTFTERERERRIRWAKMSEVVENLDSKRRPVTRSARKVGDIPYYGANGIQDYVADYIFDGTYLLVGEDGSVVRENGTAVVNWASGKIWVNNHAHVLAERSGQVSLRFLFYYLQNFKIKPFTSGGSRPKLNQGRLNEIPVPILPREEQEHIVSVLDKYDTLVKELGVSLRDELIARQRQFLSYRDSLLTFQEAG